jgi:hypothetical protein
MPVPGVGSEKELGKIRQELESTSTSDDYNNGPYTADPTSLKELEMGPGGSGQSFNVNSPSQPSGAAPHSMDEFSLYDQNTSGTSKILCTTIYETTGLTDWKEKSRLWNKHLNKHLTKYHQIGYHILFYQFTLLMKKYKPIFKLGKYMTVQRSKDLEAIMNNKQRHLPGMIVRYIFEPICYVVGWIKFNWLCKE